VWLIGTVLGLFFGTVFGLFFGTVLGLFLVTVLGDHFGEDCFPSHFSYTTRDCCFLEGKVVGRQLRPARSLLLCTSGQLSVLFMVMEEPKRP